MPTAAPTNALMPAFLARLGVCISYIKKVLPQGRTFRFLSKCLFRIHNILIHQYLNEVDQRQNAADAKTQGQNDLDHAFFCFAHHEVTPHRPHCSCRTNRW